MTYLLRKISMPKWEKNTGKDIAAYTADSITGCTRTSNNTLSVWQSNCIDFQSEDVEKIIVALAISMDKPATIDLLWLNHAALSSAGIEIRETKAKTPFTSVNDLHMDLSNLDYQKLGLVGEHIVSQLRNQETNYKRVPERDLISMVHKWIYEKGSFSVEDVPARWKEVLNSTTH